MNFVSFMNQILCQKPQTLVSFAFSTSQESSTNNGGLPENKGRGSRMFKIYIYLKVYLKIYIYLIYIYLSLHQEIEGQL